MLLEEIVQSVEIWLKLIKKPQPYVDPNLDPVLLVPGIAGSVLKAVDDNGRGERVWVRIIGADHMFRNKLWSRFDPSTGTFSRILFYCSFFLEKWICVIQGACKIVTLCMFMDY